MPIPAQCPECGAVAVEVKEVPPSNHSQGDEWYTRAECANCNGYAEWFE
ncbi:hypothetical protein [Halovenus salina]|nr:hypothetical protein [Halovenus salina]